jgi:hypothetical protein
MRLLILLFSLLPMITFAQTPLPTTPLPTLQCPECAREMGDSERYRDDSNHTFMVGYQYLSTWVVGKTSAGYTYVAGRTWSFELEYVTSERTAKIGNYEIGNTREDRYTLFAKYYLNNSFHFSFGPYYYDYDIETAGSLRNILNQNINKKLNLEGIGAAFAFGNRWQNKWGVTFGLDWVRLNYPLATTWENKETGEAETITRNDSERSFEILKKIPTFSFFTVNIGYTF